MITKKYYKLIRVSHADSEYFRITNISNEIGEFKLKNYLNGTMEYSLDGVNWTSYDLSTKPAVEVNPNSNIYLRGTGFTNNNFGCIDFNKDYTVGGNFMSLSNYATMSSVTTIDSNNRIVSAFANQTHLTSAQNLNFGVVTSVSNNGSMFFGCTALTTAPDLSGITSVGDNGMSYMFNSCSALTTAPDLSGITSVGNSGMSCMFDSCSALTTAPDLSGITSVDNNGMSYMFNSCSKLSTVTAPNINPWDTSKISNWLGGAGSIATGTKTVYCPTGVEIPTNSSSGIPIGWTRVDY